MNIADDPFNLDVLAEDNVRILKVPQGKIRPPITIILVGLPSSGKSFLVENLVAKFPLAILAEEVMLKFLAPRMTFFKKAQGQLIVLAMKTIEKLTQRGVSCIFDYNVKQKRDRSIIKQSVEGAGGKFVLIHIDISKEEAYDQVSKSNYQVTRGEKKGVILNKDLFEYEVASTQTPLLGEGALVYKPKDPNSLGIITDQISKLVNVS